MKLKMKQFRKYTGLFYKVISTVAREVTKNLERYQFFFRLVERGFVPCKTLK